MPHDRNGNLLEVGDIVNVPCKVTSVTPSEEYCNVNLETLYPMPPYTGGDTMVRNTKQCELVAKGSAPTAETAPDGGPTTIPDPEPITDPYVPPSDPNE